MIGFENLNIEFIKDNKYMISTTGPDSSTSNEITNLGDGVRIGFTDELQCEDKFNVRSMKEFCGETEMAMRRNYEDTVRG